MISECADEVKNGAEGYHRESGKRETLFDAHLTELARNIRRLFGRDGKEEVVLQAVHYYVVRFTLWCLSEPEEELNKELAREMIRGIVIRTGIMFVIQAAADDEISVTDTENMERLAVYMTKMQHGNFTLPAFFVFEKLVHIFKDQSLHMAERQAGYILLALGESVFKKGEAEETTVVQYGHPVDSSIVKMLDTPFINDIFRGLVNLNADTAMGQMLASGIPVTTENFPELNMIVDECVEKLKIKRPYVVVTNQLSGLNAMTFGSDREPYIVITSLLNKLMDEDELHFVVGHECGHIAMGHVIYHAAASVLGGFSQLIPILGPVIYNTLSFPLNAWSRRSEITADRAGLICCGSLDVAKKTLIHLESAYTDSCNLDIDSYLDNSKKECLDESGNIWQAIL